MTGAGISSHRISWNTVDAIAGGIASPGDVREIRGAERSRTLLLLRAIRDEAARSAGSAGPLPPPEQAWDLLDRVQRTAPAALETVLSYPYVAGWAGYTLRHLRRGHPADPTPDWVHLGHLHSIAAAAALHAGMDVDVRVPARNGTVPLPTVGLAHFPAGPGERWSVARVRSYDGATHVDLGDDSVQLPANPVREVPGWWPLRRIQCQEGEHTLSVRLDDLDPYRGLYDALAPRRLEDAEVRAWQHLLAGAWSLICRCLPDRAAVMSAGVDAIAPYPFPSRFPLISASSGEAFAGITIARPDAPEDLAEILVHEFQHVLLGGLLHLTPLVNEDGKGLFYAPWRDDPRPAAGVLQGVYAFFGVTEFWLAVLRSGDDALADQAAFASTRWLEPTLRTVRRLRAEAGLTEVGHRFLDRIEERLTAWRGSCPQHAVAKIVTADHHACWQLRHLRPDPDLVAELAQAWEEKRACDVPGPCTEELAPEPDGPSSTARADLLHCVVRSGGPPADPALLESTGATVADLALAERRYADALDGYRAELADAPDRPSSWIGFALAWAHLAPDIGAAQLLRRPQLVRALHRLLRSRGEAAQPDALAIWLTDRRPAGEGAHG
ncbi:HEXXH motif domain-containing protein [Streptomyces sp. NPDC059629]|uniref:HEXXH motif domain-containing protein n=1 Tax=Streptomyces sp. NPDC059629 TaxID=3346889 RepID=UPI0036A37317